MTRPTAFRALEVAHMSRTTCKGTVFPEPTNDSEEQEGEEEHDATHVNKRRNIRGNPCAIGSVTNHTTVFVGKGLTSTV